jgi:hypothetical protein
MKLFLIGCLCRHNGTAVARHEGTILKKGELGPEEVYGQLRSRILLYRKYLPEHMESIAINNLAKKVATWKKNGRYPCSRVTGTEIEHSFERAKEDANRISVNLYWKEMMSSRPRQQTELLFGLVEERITT